MQSTQTTAEGIETKNVLDELMKLGCETGQGYLFGRPERVAAMQVPSADKPARRRV